MKSKNTILFFLNCPVFPVELYLSFVDSVDFHASQGKVNLLAEYYLKQKTGVI